MKDRKKELSARGGFTLVELVVVIAILAILAGVGTAAYSGYISKANEATNIATCDAVKTAAAAALAKKSAPVTEVVVTATKVTAKVDTITYVLRGTADTGETAADDQEKKDFETYMSSNTITFKDDKTTGRWKDGKWEFT